jgi:hypothetical protein
MNHANEWKYLKMVEALSVIAFFKLRCTSRKKIVHKWALKVDHIFFQILQSLPRATFKLPKTSILRTGKFILC